MVEIRPAQELHGLDEQNVEMADMWVSDGFSGPDLGAGLDAPPAYGDHHDQLQLSQAGFEAGAAVTGDGRVNININEKTRRLSEFLAPTLRKQLAPEVKLPAGPLPPAYIPPSLGGLPGQTPPPKLNVVIQIVGSRGDVQPFIALGKVLRDTYGHRVRIATHPTFQKFVEENGLEFFSIGGDPAELMAFMVKNPGLMPKLDALKSGEVTKRRKGIEEMLMGCWRSCIEAGNGLGPPHPRHRPDESIDENHYLPGNPGERPFVADAIIANPPSFAHIHLAEKLGIPMHMMFTMPWTPTRAFPHPLANIQSTNTDVVMTNYVSYALVEMMTWQGLGDVINRFRTGILDLEPLSLIWAPGLLTRLRIPTTYCWSPALIPKPNDWMNEITISGFFFLNLASSYTPDPDLAAFLEAGPPPVYIGFGSIVVDDPNALTKIIFDAISMTGVRALVSKGWGGLGADSIGIPDGVFMLGNCPHDWLFKHVSAVVHHGGAGTSAAGINLGRPTVVVPFFGDQPFWGSMIARAGAGPEPVPYTSLTAEKLAAAIEEALRPETQARAKELGESIREEKGVDVGGKSFHEFLNTDKMRCSLAPSRVAVWRVRRTPTRLSTLAAAVLVKENIIKYSDLKLYRSIEYHTEGQPWDPISAVTAALIGDIGDITMAVADFPKEVFRAGAKPIKEGSTAGTASVATSGVPASSSATSLVPDSRSDGSSLSELPTPSVTISAPSTAEPSVVSGVTSTDRLSQEHTMPPQETRTSGTASPARSRPSSSYGDYASTANQVTLEAALGAGKGVGRIVETGMKTPMNFCLGLARGFRNAPKLYNDDTVRAPEKVTDLASGFKVAGKEFGLGLYDGISGLVTQPLKGATKEGGVGLLKGFGKGVGGLVLKPAAAFWSIPAYTMQGVHAEVRNRFRKSSLNYMITSRIVEGNQQLDTSSLEEQKDILVRWQARKSELKGFYLLKQKEKRSSDHDETNTARDGADIPDLPPKTGWRHTRNLSLDARKKLHEQKEAWQRREAERKAAGNPTSTSSSSSRSTNDALENENFERAIRASVSQTSRGDPEEDARIERAIRASVKEMRRIAEQRVDWKDPTFGPQSPGPSAPSATARDPSPSSQGHGALEDINDEEYQALIEEAVKQSLAAHAEAAAKQGKQLRVDSSSPENDDDDDDEEMRRAIEESERAHREQVARARTGDEQQSDEEEMRRAIEESEKAHRDQMARHRTEEETLMEQVMRQSLAEEEFRRARAGKGKGVSRSGDGEGGEEDEDEDEELKRALEESLRVSHGGGGGPSSFAPS